MIVLFTRFQLKSIWISHVAGFDLNEKREYPNQEIEKHIHHWKHVIGVAIYYSYHVYQRHESMLHSEISVVCESIAIILNRLQYYLNVYDIVVSGVW